MIAAKHPSTLEGSGFEKGFECYYSSSITIKASIAKLELNLFEWYYSSSITYMCPADTKYFRLSVSWGNTQEPPPRSFS